MQNGAFPLYLRRANPAMGWESSLATCLNLSLRYMKWRQPQLPPELASNKFSSHLLVFEQVPLFHRQIQSPYFFKLEAFVWPTLTMDSGHDDFGLSQSLVRTARWKPYSLTHHLRHRMRQARSTRYFSFEAEEWTCLDFTWSFQS